MAPYEVKGHCLSSRVPLEAISLRIGLSSCSNVSFEPTSEASYYNLFRGIGIRKDEHVKVSQTNSWRSSDWFSSDHGVARTLRCRI